jgi:hypothetical protein
VSEKRILVAEDYDVNFLVVERFLTRGGYLVDRAATGLAAVEAASANRYDAILMDLEMPEMDGLEATRLIRTREKETGMLPVPILALTATHDGGIHELCLHSGCDGYLAKPVRRDTVLDAVASVTGNGPANSR